MKVLTLFAVFHLPDDFEGSATDAVQAFADHFLAPGDPPILRRYDFHAEVTAAQAHLEESVNAIWPVFLKATEQGRRTVVIPAVSASVGESWVSVS